MPPGILPVSISQLVLHEDFLLGFEFCLGRQDSFVLQWSLLLKQQPVSEESPKDYLRQQKQCRISEELSSQGNLLLFIDSSKGACTDFWMGIHCSFETWVLKLTKHLDGHPLFLWNMSSGIDKTESRMSPDQIQEGHKGSVWLMPRLRVAKRILCFSAVGKHNQTKRSVSFFSRKLNNWPNRRRRFFGTGFCYETDDWPTTSNVPRCCSSLFFSEENNPMYACCWVHLGVEQGCVAGKRLLHESFPDASAHKCGGVYTTEFYVWQNCSFFKTKDLEMRVFSWE